MDKPIKGPRLESVDRNTEEIDAAGVSDTRNPAAHASRYGVHELTADDYAALPRRRNSGIELAGISFPTKDHARAYRAEIQLTYQETPFETVTGVDHTFLIDLLATHWRAEEVTGAGVERFYFTKDGHCYAARVDGTVYTFSHHDCLGGVKKKSTFDRTAADVAREIISDTVAAFKASQMREDGTWLCDVTGVALSEEQVRVHHAAPWPFARILTEFTSSHVSPARFRLRENHHRRKVAADKVERALFLNFHDERAVLKIIDRRMNSVLGANETVR